MNDSKFVSVNSLYECDTGFISPHIMECRLFLPAAQFCAGKNCPHSNTSCGQFLPTEWHCVGLSCQQNYLYWSKISCFQEAWPKNVLLASWNYLQAHFACKVVPRAFSALQILIAGISACIDMQAKSARNVWQKLPAKCMAKIAHVAKLNFWSKSNHEHYEKKLLWSINYPLLQISWQKKGLKKMGH